MISPILLPEKSNSRLNIQLLQGPTLTCAVLGKVRVNGRGCTKFKAGDRVACPSKYDGQAELINLPERFLLRVPDGVDLKAAVSLALDWVTAHQMLHHTAHIQSGQMIFVHGLSGGVGVALLSLGRIQGAQVFGTASLSKHEELRKLGAVPFDYFNKDRHAGSNSRSGMKFFDERRRPKKVGQRQRSFEPEASWSACGCCDAPSN